MCTTVRITADAGDRQRHGRRGRAAGSNRCRGCRSSRPIPAGGRGGQRRRAQIELGEAYSLGLGVAQDDADAFAWHQRSAEQGDVGAQVNLGIFYQYGLGVAQDEAETVAWNRRAAEQGEVYAQLKVGDAYADGWGVPQDEAKAVERNRRAAEQGDTQQLAAAHGRLGDVSRWR